MSACERPKPHPEPEVSIVMMTVALAEELLTRNRANRSIRRSIVDRYAKDMLAGRWRANSMMQLDAWGDLIDGQHRCLAVVQSGVDIPVVLMRGVTDEDRLAIDTGVRRSLSDHLKFLGERSWVQLAAAVNLSWAWELGRVSSAAFDTPTSTEAVAWLRANPGIRDALVVAAPVSRKPLRLPHSVGSAFAYRATMVAPDDATGFFEELTAGVNLTEDDPVHALRRYLLARAAERSITRQPTFMAVTIKAWNAWLLGRPVKALAWRRGGASGAEPFPTLLGRDEADTA